MNDCSYEMLNKNLNDKVKQRNTYRVPRKRSQALSISSLSINSERDL